VLLTHTAFPQSQILAKSKSEKRLLTRAETAVALVCAVLRAHCVCAADTEGRDSISTQTQILAKSKSKKVID